MIKMQSGHQEHQVTDQCNGNKRKKENSEAFISLSFSQKSFTSETLDQIYCANKSPERETLPHSHFCCLLLNLRVILSIQSCKINSQYFLKNLQEVKIST